VAGRQASVARELLSGEWFGSLFLCQPLLLDRFLAWESSSLVRRSINSYHASFAGGKSSAIRHLLSVDAGRWTVVCR
jgi:hypothetical protein